MDTDKLYTLGPYAKALHKLLTCGDMSDMKREDGLSQGFLNGSEGPLGHFTASFLVFRGALMRSDWVKDWIDGIGKDIRIPATTSTSKTLQIAL